MTPERYQFVTRLFLEACERPVDQRTAFVDSACGDDADCRAALEQMLTHDGRPLAVSIDHLLGDMYPNAVIPAVTGGAREAPLDASIAPRPTGRFRMLRTIGEGGMGVVYLAEQAQPRREVALKVIRTGLASSRTLRRFRHEADILARLSHPGIAQIYEAGLAEVDGEWLVVTGAQPRATAVPYFAMELVRGQPIDAYARTHRLGTPARLELIAKVCDAVHHAHQRGVIHRDLKPANVLVSDELQIADCRLMIDDGVRTREKSAICNLQSAIPKVLDFGVARVIDDEVQARTLQTEIGQLVGTLSYMSPEQISGAPDIDARSDVYTLGVVLFQLLAGRLPYDLKDRPVSEVGRIIREEDPPRLRTAVDLAVTGSGDARPMFCGEVETIVAKALEKDPAQRYPSAAELAADIRRYLRAEPIVARPPSTLYHLRKFAERHKGLVAGITAAFVVLAAALVAVSIQGLRIRREANRAKEVSAFLETLLSAADPYPLHHSTEIPRHFGIGARYIDVLDDAVARLDAHPLTSPEAEATIRYRMGLSYYGLGRYRQGAAMLERALSIRRACFGAEDPHTLECQVGLVWNRTMLLDSFAAERLAQETVAAYGRTLGWHHEDTLKALGALTIAELYLGYFDDALASARRMCEIVETSPRALNFTTLLPRLLIADLYVRELGRVEEGEALAWQIQHEVESGPAARTNLPGYCTIVLGRAARAKGQPDEAERLLRAGIDAWAAVAATQALNEFRGELATLISQRPHRVDEGLALWREIIAAHQEEYGRESPVTFVLGAKYGAALESAGRLDEAEQTLRWCVYEWIESGRYSPIHRHVALLHSFGRLLRERGKLDEAERVLTQGLALAQRIDPLVWRKVAFDPGRLDRELGLLLEQQGRHD